MKKNTIGILSFFVLMALASACKKDYSCKCTISTMGMTADTTMSLGKMTKKDAKAECNTYESNYKSAAAIAAAMGFNVSVNCDVK